MRASPSFWASRVLEKLRFRKLAPGVGLLNLTSSTWVPADPPRVAPDR